MQKPGQALEYGGSWVEHLNNAGISVAAHDMQSCGFSEGVGGRRSFFTAFEDLVADTLQFRRCHMLGGKLPWVLAAAVHESANLQLLKRSDAHALVRMNNISICRLIPQSGVSGFGADLPVFVSGMSLGGCIALHALLSAVRL
jgi:alpha-beta hydrolase superfamily lysophospholipase